MGTSDPNNYLNRPATLKDVARLAGVAPSTVSRVLNHPDIVNDKTREKILECIKKLDYHPNPFASGLQTNNSKTIALVIPSLSNLAFANFAHGVQKGLEQTPYGLIVASSDEQRAKEEAICQMLRQRWVDGVIFASSAGGNPPIELLPREIPIVLVDRTSSNERADSFLYDIEAGVAKVCRHLTELGHQKIAIITGDPGSITGRERLRAFKKALAAYGLELPEPYIEKGQWTTRGGWEAMHRLLSLPQRPTAVFAVTDTMAMGAIGAAASLGLNVPQDLSVVGFNNEPGSAEYNPPLTTLDASSFEMGKDAALAILKRLVEPTRPAQKITYALRLVVRASTAVVAE